MNDESVFAFILVFCLAVYSWNLHSDNKKLNSALNLANDRIISLNAQIIVANGVAWQDYHTMGYALENLHTESQVFIQK